MWVCCECLAWQSKSNSGLTATELPQQMNAKKSCISSANISTMSACILLPLHSTASLFCLSELITEPLVSGSKYHHATDGNWIPLIGLNNCQQTASTDAEKREKKRRKSQQICPAGRHAELTGPAGRRVEEAFFLFSQVARGDSLTSNVSIYAAFRNPQLLSTIPPVT